MQLQWLYFELKQSSSYLAANIRKNYDFSKIRLLLPQFHEKQLILVNDSRCFAFWNDVAGGNVDKNIPQ